MFTVTTETDGVVKLQPARTKRCTHTYTYTRCAPLYLMPPVNTLYIPFSHHRVSGEPQAVSITHYWAGDYSNITASICHDNKDKYPQCSSLCVIVMELDGFEYLSLDDLTGLIHDTEMDIWFKFLLTSSRLEF